MQVGEIVGNYRIAGELDAGEVGAVYLAKHTLIGREAAIQVLPPELSGNAVAVAQFLSEAKTTAGIKHPGIVEVVDSGYTRDGRAYLVMERLEGESLGARLRRKGKLSLEQAVAIARQVSGALYAAHKIGIVHRGLKPDCITLLPDPDVPGGERAKILDFGVARLLESDEGLRREGQKSGLGAAYLAPEQCDGSDRVDHRTDLYALGCILFELVCGRPPFDGMSHGVVLAQHLREVPPAPSSIEPRVGRDLDQLVLRLLEKDPERRFPDAFELLTRFHELSGLAAPTAPVPGSITMLNTPAPEGPSGVINPTLSGVVSSARRTLALGPRYRGAAKDSLPRTVTVATGTQRRKHPREDTAEPDDAHEETIDRNATQDDELPSSAGDTPFGPLLDESNRGGMFNDPSVDRLLPLPPPPAEYQAMDAALSAAPQASATQMMGSGSAGPPRARIAPGTAAVPVSAAPAGPPPPPGSPGRPGGGGPGSGGPPPPPGVGGRTMAMPPGPPAGGPPPPSGPRPSAAPAGKSREPFGGSADLIMTLPAVSLGDELLAQRQGPNDPPAPHGPPPASPHGSPPGSPHGSPPPGGFASPPDGFASPPDGFASPPGGFASPPGGFASPPGGFASPPGGMHSPPPGGMHSPPPGGFPSGGMHSPPPGGMQSPPGGFPPPSGGMHSPPPGGMQSPPSGGMHSSPPGGMQSPPPGGFPPPPGGMHSPPSGGMHSPPPGSGHGDPSMGGPPYPPPFPPGPPGTSAGPPGGPMGGPMGLGGPPPPAPPLGPPGGPPPPAPPLGAGGPAPGPGGPPPPAPPLGAGGPAPGPGGPPPPAPPLPGGPGGFGPQAGGPPMFNEPFPRPMVRREDAMRAGVHVPGPRGSGTSSRAVRIGGLIVAVALAIGVVSAYAVATRDDDESDSAGTTPAVAAAATGTPAAVTQDAGATGGVAAAGSSSGDAGAGVASTAGSAGAVADAGALAADDKPADDVVASAGDRPSDKPADDVAASAGDKPADKPDDDKVAPADKPADDVVATADRPADDVVGTADDKPADDKPAAGAPSDRAPTEPVEDKETRRRPAALITLQIDSLPRGAAVIRKRDGVRLGETPFTYQTEPQRSPISIILRHRGYRDEVVTLPGNRSADRRVPMTRTDGRDRAPSLND